MNFWLNFKKKVADLLERESQHIRLMAWRDRITKVLIFLDNHILRITAIVALVLFLFSIFYIFSWRAPSPFPEQALITIERGESLTQVANSFKQKNIIRSDFWLKTFIVILGGEKRVVAGDYYFPTATNIFRVAKMIHKGEFGLIALRVTLPEGSSSIEMAEILKKQLPNFNAEDFKKEVADNNYEGFLFPDTYFLTPNVKASDVILMMRENFTRQTKPYEADIIKFQKPLNEIIIMASIIEDEANRTLESKRIVSGILWKRLRMKMPLQVDAPFQYYNGKNSYTLTKEDLKQDHEYNTYLNKGLPPTAITNPGIDSIRAAITPTPTEYLYFMSDKSGNMYYAKNFEGHQTNREAYLR
ncbi:MAG: endolytic transglycosylase MltG [Candidatus Paceibacterota bacterium]|jgi:UPF0755 protein